MDGKRWVPLVNTPNKPPVPPFLVPDPSPAPSSISERDSPSILQPSPQGSFIHRRRQGQYVPRPPVWAVSGFNGDLKNLDLTYDSYSGNPSSSSLPIIQLPGMTNDDHVRYMASVFNDQPLTVHMMTGQAGSAQTESDDEDERNRRLYFDLQPVLEANSININTGRLGADDDHAWNAQVAEPSNPSPYLVNESSGAPNSLETPLSAPHNHATEASTSSQPGPALNPSVSQADEGIGKVPESASASFGSRGASHPAAIPTQSEHRGLEPITASNESGRRIHFARNIENEFVFPAAHDAANLPVATRIPRALENSPETEDAGLADIPAGPPDQRQASPPQDSVPKRSFRKWLSRSLGWSTEREGESSHPPDLAAPLTRPRPWRNRDPDHPCTEHIEDVDAVATKPRSSFSPNSSGSKEKQTILQKAGTMSQRMGNAVVQNMKDVLPVTVRKPKMPGLRRLKSRPKNRSSSIQEAQQPTLQTGASDEAGQLVDSSGISPIDVDTQGTAQPEPPAVAEELGALDIAADDVPRAEEPRQNPVASPVYSVPFTELPMEPPNVPFSSPESRQGFPQQTCPDDCIECSSRSWDSRHPSQASRFRPQADCSLDPPQVESPSLEGSITADSPGSSSSEGQTSTSPPGTETSAGRVEERYVPLTDATNRISDRWTTSKAPEDRREALREMSDQNYSNAELRAISQNHSGTQTPQEQDTASRLEVGRLAVPWRILFLDRPGRADLCPLDARMILRTPLKEMSKDDW